MSMGRVDAATQTITTGAGSLNSAHRMNEPLTLNSNRIGNVSNLRSDLLSEIQVADDINDVSQTEGKYMTAAVNELGNFSFENDLDAGV